MSYPLAAREQKTIAANVDYWCRYADVVIPGFVGPDGFGRWDVLIPSQLSIDLAVWKSSKKLSVADGIKDKVVVVHSPNHRGFKGTEFVIDAVEKLQKEGLNIELRLLENIQNSEVQRILCEEADILVEQLIFTGHGLNGLEGMASGSDAAPVVVRDLLCTVDVPVGRQESAGGIAVGRGRTVALAPQGGATSSLRVLLVHTVIYCCEQLRAGNDPSTPEHAQSASTLGAWLKLLVAAFSSKDGATTLTETDDWDAFLEEVAQTHYWERHHLDLLAHLLPTTSKEPPYLVSTARTGVSNPDLIPPHLTLSHPRPHLNLTSSTPHHHPHLILTLSLSQAGVGVALCAAILRALPTIRGARNWDLDGLETATACVETLAMVRSQPSPHPHLILTSFSPHPEPFLDRT